MSLKNQIQPRLKLPGGNSYPYSQSQGAFLVNQGYKKEYVYNTASLTPQWGGSTTITLKRNGIIHNNALLVNCSGLVGSTTTSLCPATCIIDSITIESSGGKSTQFLTGLQQFISQNTFLEDQYRYGIRMSVGDYASLPQRLGMSSGFGSTYIIPLADLCLESGDYFLGNSSHELTFKIVLKSLSSVVTPSNANVTMQINSMTMVSEITRLAPSIMNSRLSAMSKVREVSVFHDMQRFSSIIPAGTTTFSQLITLNKNVTNIQFVIRTANPQNESLFSNFLPVLSYSLLQNGQPLCNTGIPLDGNIWLKYLNPYPSNITYETNSSANIYGLSFSSDTIVALQSGCMLGSVLFTGNEMLQLNLVANANQLQVDVFVYYESNLIQGINGNDVTTTSYNNIA